MTSRHARQIRTYCEERGIEIPPGFARHPVGRYAAIHLEALPYRLVASTWPNHKGVIDYLARFGMGKLYRLLDLETLEELHYAGGTKLKRGEQTGTQVPIASSDRARHQERIPS